MRKHARFLALLALGLFAAVAPAQEIKSPAPSIYHDGWIDLNKNGKMDPYENPKLPIEDRITNLLSQMTLEEKSCQMATLYGFGRVLKDEIPTPAWKTAIWKDGIANIDEQLNGVRGQSEWFGPPSKHAEAINLIQKFFIEETRLGIPCEMTNEGIRGLCAWRATSFPSQSGQGCTFDVDLISGIGHVTGKEAKAFGFTNVYSPILDLARDQRWGRAVECYTEEPYLGSVMGVAEVKGIQAEGVASTAKHYAIYSIPKGGRDGDVRTDPHASWREIQTINLAPFRAAVKEGHIMGVMASYNDYDGIPVAASKQFLTDILRKEWGFKGYVVSDSDSVAFISGKHAVATDYKDAARQAVLAGLNVRTTFNAPDTFINPVRALAKDGGLPMTEIDRCVRDVLRVKFALGEFDHPYVKDPAASDKIVNCQEHRNLALRAAHESIVLLKNAKNTLPLSKNLKSLLVCGPNAMLSVTDRYGPQGTKPPTVLDGIKAAVDKSCDVRYAKGCDIKDKNYPESDIMRFPIEAKAKAQIDEAVKAAEGVDAIIAVVGEDNGVVGEGKSRVSLDLPGNQNDLLQALSATGKPVIVVLLNGRPLSINWVDQNLPAVLEAWFPGEFGGRALADVIFGDYNPGGKLAFTFPKSVGQIPFNFPCNPGSQRGGNACVDGALYPFGYGLSYTSFKLENLKITPLEQSDNGYVTVAADLTNTGQRKGDEVVQLYVRDVVGSVITPERQLRGFQRITLAPGEKKSVSFTLKAEDLQLYDRNLQWTVEPGDFLVTLGTSSDDAKTDANALSGAFAMVGSGKEMKAQPSNYRPKASGGKKARGKKTLAPGQLEGDPNEEAI